MLGCHIVGDEGPETIQLAAIAVKAGLTKAQWDATCALHPTVSEELVTLREKYMPSGAGSAPDDHAARGPTPTPGRPRRSFPPEGRRSPGRLQPAAWDGAVDVGERPLILICCGA